MKQSECRISRHIADQPMSMQYFHTQQKHVLLKRDTMLTSITCLIFLLHFIELTQESMSQIRRLHKLYLMGMAHFKSEFLGDLNLHLNHLNQSDWEFLTSHLRQFVLKVIFTHMRHKDIS